MVAYEEMVADCDQAELDIHQRLAWCRVNGDREFFRVPLKDALKVILEVVGLIAIPSTDTKFFRELRPTFPGPQMAIDWALSMLVKGRDSFNLRILAGLSPDTHVDEVERHYRKAVIELRIRDPFENYAA